MREEQSLCYKLNQDLQRLKDLDVTRELDNTSFRHRFEDLQAELIRIENEETSMIEGVRAFESRVQGVCSDLCDRVNTISRQKLEI